MNKTNKTITLGSNVDRGMFSYLNTTIGNIYYAIKKEYNFHIDWSSAKYYSDKNGDNVFDYYFEQPSLKNKLNDKNQEIYFFEEHIDVYGIDWLNKENRTHWNDIINKNLILKEYLKKEINDFYKENFNCKVLGVHRRGTDHGTHINILPTESFFKVIDEKLEQGYDKVFLATDDQLELNKFVEKYKDKLIFSDCVRSGGLNPVFKIDEDRRKQGSDVIKDMFLLSMCDFLIKTRSTVSSFSLCVNPDIEFINLDDNLSVRS